jgi:RimJ/RimL family protein N-acetyltransferase
MLSIDQNITLRRAELSDIHELYLWKNDDESRASAIETKGQISWETHVAWVERTLARQDVELYIILYDGKKAGSWRYDMYDDRVECSLLISPDFRKLHIGLRVFGWGTDYIEKRTGLPVVCKVVEGNIAPMRYHIRSGFLPYSYDAAGKFYLWRRDARRT